MTYKLHVFKIRSARSRATGRTTSRRRRRGGRSMVPGRGDEAENETKQIHACPSAECSQEGRDGRALPAARSPQRSYSILSECNHVTTRTWKGRRQNLSRPLRTPAPDHIHCGTRGPMGVTGIIVI